MVKQTSLHSPPRFLQLLTFYLLYLFYYISIHRLSIHLILMHFRITCCISYFTAEHFLVYIINQSLEFTVGLQFFVLSYCILKKNLKNTNVIEASCIKMGFELLKVGTIWGLLLLLNIRICPPTGCLDGKHLTITALHDSTMKKHQQSNPHLTTLARLVREPTSSCFCVCLVSTAL